MSENKRIIELIEILNEANRAYETENRQIMTDFEYDKLYDELLLLEGRTGIVMENSPTNRVGHEIVSNLVKVRHDRIMLSLDKTKEVSRLEEFLKREDDPRVGVLSWKLDGLSIILKYTAGRLAQALTRGNGEIGEDVTHNARFFSNIPLEIDFMGDLTVRGEAVITFSEFEKINEDLPVGEQYKNPRNLCSGTIRQLNTRIAAARKVEYYPFSLMDAEDLGFAKKSDGLKFLADRGFEVAEYRIVAYENVAEAVEYFKNTVHDQDFATDGLVLTYDDVDFSRELGATSKFPRDSVAFKWADEMKTTRLLDIEWNTSRTGLINPIAIFKPVDIEGTTVERASLHNISILEGLQLGVGDEISVYKANMIIPQIAENFTKSGAVTPPDHCLVCASATMIKEENGTKTLHCTNPNCRARVVRTITHYASRNAMNIEGFSLQTVEKFCEMGWLTDFSDIYNLSDHEEAIKAMRGFGEKSFVKLMESIERSKNVNLANFIYGLGIDDLGLAGAKLLCARFGNKMEAILDAAAQPLPKVFEDIKGFGEVMADNLRACLTNKEYLARMQETLAESGTGACAIDIFSKLDIPRWGLDKAEMLCAYFDNDIEAIIEAARHKHKPFEDVEGFGKEIASSLRIYFTDKENLIRINKVLPRLHFAQERIAEANEDSPIFGKTFVITGDLNHFKNRKELQEHIEAHGGKVAGSVSKKTDYLINNDAGSPSTKNKKATELGVTIVTEEGFLALEVEN